MPLPSPLTPRQLDALQDLALVALCVAFVIAATALAPRLGYDAPRAWPVGHAYFFYGHPTHPIAALHHGSYHATHQVVLGWLVGPRAAPGLVGVLYCGATLVLLGAWARRQLGPIGWLAPLLLATTPAFFALAVAPSHEHAGIFWLCASWMLLDRLEPGARAHPGHLLTLAIAALMAAGADHGSLLGVACLAIVASWRSRAAALVLGGATALGALIALPRGGVAELLFTMDARFFFGFDHLARVPPMLLATAALVPLVLLLPWLGIAAFRALRGRTMPAASLIVTLVLVAGLEIVVLREPGWSSNLLYLCVAAALASTSLAALVLARLTDARASLRLAGTAALAVVLALPGAVGVARVAAWPRAAQLELYQGMRAAQLEGHGRAVVALAEGMLESGETLYLGPDVVCSLSCMETGTHKVYIDRETLAQGLPSQGLLLVWQHVAAHAALLDEVPALSVSGFRLYDLDAGGARGTVTPRTLRMPLSRVLPRALALPAADALLAP